MPTGTSNAPCIVLFTVNVKERVGMLTTRTFGYYAPSGPAGSRCDLGDLLLSFLLSFYDRFAAWASITVDAAEDPLLVDYCRLPD